MRLKILFVAGLLFSASWSRADLKPIEIDHRRGVTASRWASSSRESTQKLSPRAQALVAIKRAFNEGQFQVCTDRARQAERIRDGLQGWIILQRLRCAEKIADGKARGAAVDSALTDLREAMKAPPSDASLVEWQKTYHQSAVTLVTESVPVARARAQKWVDELLPRLPLMTLEQDIAVLRAGGELAAVRQNFELARYLLLQSLRLRPSPELRERIQSLELRLGGTSLLPPPNEKADDKEIDADPGEVALFDRLILAERQGNLVAMVEDGVQLLQRFPGGRRADQVSDKIRVAFLGVLSREGESFRLIRQRMKKEMQTVRGLRRFNWADAAYGRGYYAEALDLFRAGFDDLGDTAVMARAYLMAANSAVFTGQNSAARDFYEMLITRFAGTIAQRSALLRLALLSMREGEVAKAVALLERLVAIQEGGEDRLSAMYWLWRAYQRAGQPQADALRDRVMKEYPFTYFGLRATLEAQADRILRRVEPKEAVKVPPLKVWLVGPDRARWSLALQLMEAGWFDEARVELQAFALPTEDSAAVTTAWFWGRAFQHNRAIEVMTRYFSGRTTDINDPFLRIGFPLEYSEVIDAQARTRSLDPLLVHALIRQESSYRSDVESPARARGLMQIVPATATEVAQDLKDASFKSIEDLDNPQRNIRFGVFYLAKLVRAHRGNLPLALAAYNAGIGNVSRWVAGRWKVDEFRGTLSSDPLHEIWIEELPWLETNLYVKSILRNFILYSLLEKGTFVLQDPLWTSALPPLAK